MFNKHFNCINQQQEESLKEQFITKFAEEYQCDKRDIKVVVSQQHPNTVGVKLCQRIKFEFTGPVYCGYLDGTHQYSLTVDQAKKILQKKSQEGPPSTVGYFARRQPPSLRLSAAEGETEERVYYKLSGGPCDNC